MKFQNTKLVVASLLHMTTNEIVRMSCDPSGSHVLEAFMSSHTVPVKKKRKLAEKLKVRILMTSCGVYALAPEAFPSAFATFSEQGCSREQGGGCLVAAL